MEIKDRIKELMDFENLTAMAFAESIEVSQATISHILGGRNKNPSTDFIMRLYKKYSYINLNWLLTGEGNMTTKKIDAITPINIDENEKNNNNKNVDLFSATSINSTPQSSNINLNIKSDIEKKPDVSIKKITEIRVFFDDNTYQIFKPEK